MSTDLDKPMSILIPMLGFARAGGYRVLSKLADEWLEMGHQVDFLVPETSPFPYFPTMANVIRCNRSGPLPEKSTKPEAGRRTTAVDNLLSLYAGVKTISENYDAILANHSFTVWPVWAARTKRAKLVYYIQAYEPDYYALEGKWFSWLLSRFSYKLPFHQIVNSKIYVGHKGLRADEIVPPGLDFDVFQTKETDKVLSSAKEILVGTIGRSEPAKGTIYALEGFALAHLQNRRLKLKVAYGNLPDGWSHSECSVVVPHDDEELADYYRSLDILLAPGITQHGAPHYPVMEAMACGVAVVTTGYLPADEQNSWIVDNMSAESVCEGILRVINDSHYLIKTGQASRDIAPFSWPHIAKQMMAIIVAGPALSNSSRATNP